MRVALISLLMVAALKSPAAAAPTAEELYAQGQEAYDHADYAAAIDRWSAAYDISGERGLLFNLAQAQRLSGDCKNALATYRRFVAADPEPTSEQHKLAEDFTRELEPACGAHAVEPLKEATTEPHPAQRVDDQGSEDVRPGRTLRVAGISIGGTGGAVLVTGLLLGHLAHTLGSEVTDTCTESCYWAAQKAKDARGRRYETIGYALDAIGIAAIAGGMVTYYFGHRRSAAVISSPSEGGAVVSWSGSW